MNQLPAADSALREKLGTYTDPYLGQTLARGEGDRVGVIRSATWSAIELVLGFPCADYAAGTAAGAASAPRSRVSGRCARSS